MISISQHSIQTSQPQQQTSQYTIIPTSLQPMTALTGASCSTIATRTVTVNQSLSAPSLQSISQTGGSISSSPSSQLGSPVKTTSVNVLACEECRKKCDQTQPAENCCAQECGLTTATTTQGDIACSNPEFYDILPCKSCTGSSNTQTITSTTNQGTNGQYGGNNLNGEWYYYNGAGNIVYY